MRTRVLAEEPLCRMCVAKGLAVPSTDADHIVPLAEGGSAERSNYQGLCRKCHIGKTAREAARARKRNRED